MMQSLTLPQDVKQPPIFELELPELQILPSSKPEVTIPYSSINQIFLHIRKPLADNVDYGDITTSVNGQAAGVISEVVSGLQGKIVKINLGQRPGYRFVTGRNTVEVSARNRRGRMYYTSFVIKTAHENWNEDFTYEVIQPPGAKNQIPPKVVLLEPQQAVHLPPSLENMSVKISGTATTNNAITRVTVDGANVQFKVGPKRATRQLVRVESSEQTVAFEMTTKISKDSSEIVVEVEDKSGSRTRVLIPVIIKNPGTIIPVGRQKYALIIGISRYKNSAKGIRNLEYADVDARAIYELLQQPSAGGFSRENMLLLANEDATAGRISEALTHFVAKASVNDLLLIFFAGHGAHDRFAPQNLYLIAHDTDVFNMPATALSMPGLRSYLDQNIKSKRVVLLMDACHSGGFSTEGTRDLGNNLANQYLQKMLYQEEGRAIITSSDVNELSHESERWGHGVFTYYLLQGLKGSADVNSDRFVSVGELFRYIRQNVRSDTGSQQNPRMLTGDNENLPLAVVRAQ